MTLGELTAAHIGATLQVRNGGALYEGQLVRVHHERGGYPERIQTWIGLESGSWRHFDRYASNTECALAEMSEEES